MKRALIIGLALLAVILVVVVVLRPGGSGRGDPDEPGNLVELIGDLTPKHHVTAADLVGQACWSGADLQVASGQTCQTPLPEKANRLALCVTSGSFAAVRVQGSDYAAQKPDLPSCSDGVETITVYDQYSVLSVVCLLGPCGLRLT